ncbi:Deleted in malignant brain tumors 1 protein [Holothuria leucospilota]|uniref:Deleted in malignant brain tumors 1 protein n=1 Tax=Holothuria leucospilota TaxID=206669 RepID=A0A9Q1BSC9_HOLLE|nr:Deleted in malignant brain tumors 1 protein [Holothuria leucospilota]
MQGKSGGMRLLRLFLLVTLLTGADADNDYTCTSSQPLFPSVSPVHLYLAGSGRPPIHFDRYLASGNTVPFTEGNQTQLSEDIAGLEIPAKCPRNRYGIGCEQYCICYNGGICNDVGECICPPGFIGNSCEDVNSPNCFGAQCQYLCDDEVFNLNHFQGTCGGNLFCLPDPYGCSCSPGYHGLGCDEECAEGKFGANCQQTCHCASGSTCDNKMGLCTPSNCQDGWTGVNCNQQITCRHEPCLNGGTCYENQTPQDFWCSCRTGFTGDRCAVCGGVFTDPTGTFHSPLYPEQYPNNSRCIYVIEAEEGEFIRLTFTMFSIEYDLYCEYDYVEVYDNTTGGFMGRYCGDDILPVLTSEGHVMTVVFHSDSSVTETGFTAIYEVLESSPAVCGGVFTDPTGIFHSPLYPDQYLNNSNCVYVIKAEEGEFIRLNFAMFSIEYQDNCQFDYVEVYDNTTGGFMGRYCGSDIPPALISAGHIMTVVFHSDDSVIDNGFTVYYEVLESLPGEGLIRLVGGATASEGRVEVFHDGEWGTICGDLWDNDDATVICRQLGFGDSGSGLVSTTFGQGVGKIWLDEVDCSGSESKISDCRSRGWGVHDCSHDDDAGVICEMS